MEPRRARTLLLLGLAPLLAYLLLGDKPWELPGGPGFAAERGDPLFVTVKIAIWWAALVNVALTLALLATVRLWTAEPEPPPAAPAPATSLGARFAVLLGLVCLLGAGLRVPLYGSGLFWDEAWTVKRAVLGHFEEEDGALVFEPLAWHKTLWTYHKPTNHVLQSVAARVSNTAWQKARGLGPEAFDERALRLPSLLASVLAIPLLALAVRAWGWPRAALVAAFLLAMQPWHIRWAATLRGYGFAVLGVAASAWVLTHVVRTGRWRWLAAYAVAQVLMFWSHPYSFYATLALGVATAAVLALERRPRLLARFFVANLLAGMFLLQVMAPNFAQVGLWQNVHDIEEGSRVRMKGLRGVWALSAVGVPWHVPPSAPELDWPSVEIGHLPSRVADAVVLPLLVLVGLGAALRRPGSHRAAVLGLALAPLAGVAGALLQGHSFYPRFLLYAVVPSIAFLAVGSVALAGWLGRGRPGLERVLVAGAVVLWLALAWPQVVVHLTRPHSGMRDAVSYLDGRPGLHAGWALGGDNAKVYEPRLRYFETPRELTALEAEAEREGVPLLVFYAYRQHNGRRRPDTLAALDDRARYEVLEVLPAVEPEFVYRVLRWRGALSGSRPAGG